MGDYRTIEEKQANVFASMLLMPQSLLPQKFGHVQSSFEQAEMLKQGFKVSLAAALRRMVRLSNWACAVVVTKDGHLQWSARSDEFDGWIAAQPHPLSGASRLLESPEGSSLIDEVPEDMWLDSSYQRGASSECVLREHSRRMRNGYVYTLLTQPCEDA